MTSFLVGTNPAAGAGAVTVVVVVAAFVVVAVVAAAVYQPKNSHRPLVCRKKCH